MEGILDTAPFDQEAVIRRSIEQNLDLPLIDTTFAEELGFRFSNPPVINSCIKWVLCDLRGAIQQIWGDGGVTAEIIHQMQNTLKPLDNYRKNVTFYLLEDIRLVSKRKVVAKDAGQNQRARAKQARDLEHCHAARRLVAKFKDMHDSIVGLHKMVEPWEYPGCDYNADDIGKEEKSAEVHRLWMILVELGVERMWVDYRYERLHLLHDTHNRREENVSRNGNKMNR